MIKTIEFKEKDGIITYKDIPILKAPWDIETILTILEMVKPDIIIETGTAYGGSALLYADFMETIGIDPCVITIEDKSHFGGDGTKIDGCTMKGYIPASYEISHAKGVRYLNGNSTSKDTLSFLKNGIAPETKVLVNLDSDHHEENVYAELKGYCDFVSVGSYLIVEDMKIQTLHTDHGQGPDRAVERFLKEDTRFEVNESLNDNRSLNFGGYLKRVY